MTGQELSVIYHEPRKSTVVWRHKKTGGLYRVIARALLEATEERVIVYANTQTNIVWVRPEKEFLDGRFEVMP